MIIHELRIPLSKIKLLGENERYVYYLLGHIFNELIFFQKTIAFALPKGDDNKPIQQDAEFGQALLLFRLALSKVWEASTALRSKGVSDALQNLILPVMADGPARWKQFCKAINDAKWLNSMRNKVGFHYPNFDDWRKFISPSEDWIDDSIYLARESGNVFYQASDSVCRHWMCDQIDAKDLHAAMDTLITEMIELLRMTTQFIEDALGAFISEVVAKNATLSREIEELDAPDFEKFELPFWTTMAKKAL